MVHHKPFLGVHHLEGHIYATYLSQPELQPPFLCLLVSGGHTSLIHVRGCGIMQYWAKPETMPLGRPLTRWRGYWGWAILVAPSLTS
jgi:tRNA A37 threonylcarbamoyltransferase TsaD